MRSSIDAVQIKVFQFKRFGLSIRAQPVPCRCDSGQRIVAEADARCHVRVRRQVSLIPDLRHQQAVALRLIIGRRDLVAVETSGNPPRLFLQPVVFVIGGTKGEIKRVLRPSVVPILRPGQIVSVVVTVITSRRRTAERDRILPQPVAMVVLVRRLCFLAVALAIRPGRDA